MKGLKGIQKGVDPVRKGVSAKKIVTVDESSSNLSERHQSGRLALIPALLHHLDMARVTGSLTDMDFRDDHHIQSFQERTELGKGDTIG